MAVKIEIIKGDTPNSKIYIMSMPIKSHDIYELAKEKRRFIDRETKVLEMVIESDLREILRDNGIIARDGSKLALNEAILDFARKGKSFEIYDRYNQIANEKIVGESENQMTVILENDTLSCAMEVVVNG